MEIHRMRRELGAALAVLLLLAASPAFAFGRGGPPGPNINAPVVMAGAPVYAARQAWHGAARAYASSSALVNEAARYIGSGKFTGLPGAWCADAVSAWLRAVGKPPLPNRTATSALAYGPHVANPMPGDLIVMSHHVGIVEGVERDGSIDMVSGNWSHRVARGRISRRQVVAFVRT